MPESVLRTSSPIRENTAEPARSASAYEYDKTGNSVPGHALGSQGASLCDRHLWLARFGEVEYQEREASAAVSGRLPGSGAQP